MGMVGRPPDLTAQRTGDNPVDSRDAAGTVTHMTPPEGLSVEAEEAWHIIVPPLLQAKILRPEDAPLLIEACEAWAMVWYFRRAMWGEIQGTADASEIKRLRSGWDASLRQARGMLAELGIGPVARIRTGLMKAGGGQGLLGQIEAGEPGPHD